jgi:hypothetical protein
MRSMLATVIVFLGLLVVVVASRPLEHSDPNHQQQGLVFDPEHQKAIEYSDSTIAIRLEIIKDDKLRLAVFRKNIATAYVILPNEMMQVNEIRRGTKGRFVVVGMVNGDLSEIGVVATDPPRLIDHFLCYVPTPSPDNRFISFIKFFPTHPAQSVTDHYMLYDVAQSPQLNRPRGIPLSDDVTVGLCIFPRGAGNKVADNFPTDPTKEDFAASDGFSWRDDSMFFAFANLHQSELTLILVRIGSGRPAPSITTAIVPRDHLCSTLSNCYPRAQSIEFVNKPNAALRVTFAAQGVNMLRTTDFTFDKFSSEE